MKKILDPKNLPYAGALVQAVLFAIAGSSFFSNPFFGALVGLGVGAVVNYSIALASTRISEIADKRKPLARLALVTMFCLSPTTITLSLFYPSSIFTGIAWALCVDLSVVLAGAIVGKSMLPATTPHKSAEPKRANVKTRTADFTCRNAGNGCGRKFVSQNSANAHARACQFKPVKIDQSLLIKTKEETRK